MAKDTTSRQADAPMDRLKSEARGLITALGDRALSSVRDKVEGAAGRLTDYVDEGAGPGLMAAVTGAKGLAEGQSPARALMGAGTKAVTEKLKGKGGGKGKNLKVTNIVESIDVGAPVSLTYNLWTQFPDFPSFMKKVESVEQADEEQKHRWKAQVLWSHRTWESTILEQAPDEKIIWRSKGAKGHVDGAVTFHELAPRLTRVLVVLEYYPQGFFEHTGNLWRAQGRRVRLELKHFRRHLMSEVLLHPDEIEGWRGVIEDGEVVQDHEPAGEEEPRLYDRDEGDDEDTDAEDTDAEDEDAEDAGDAGDEEDEEPGEDEQAAEEDADERDDGWAGNGRSHRASRAPARRDGPARRRSRADQADGAERRPQRSRPRRGEPARGEARR